MRTTLLSLDHFKVYHDATNAMQIRNVLDAWSFKPDSDAPAAKIRVLKGAILALVDERSKGVLTC